MSEYSTPIILDLVEGAYLNPLYQREWVFMDEETPLAGVVLMQVPHEIIANRVHIAELRAMSKGGGRKAMELITKRADEMGVSLDLSPVPRRAGFYMKPMTLRKLVAWYKKFGFVLHGTIRDGYMIRQPKQKVAENPI
jgi:hypothetical protein